MMKKKLFPLTLAAAIGLSAFLYGCGSDQANTTAPEDTGSSPVSETDAAGDSQETAADAGTIPGGETVGEWELVYINGKNDYLDGTDSDYFILRGDDEGIESRVKISEKDNGLQMDYYYQGYESSEKIYGAQLTYKNEAAYEGCVNDRWCLEMADPFEEQDSSARKVTLSDDDMLIICESYSYQDESDPTFGYTSTYEYRYIKKDDKRLEDLESFRYFDTVSVSNVAEFVNSLRNNRIVELEEGTYDLSRLFSAQIDNPRVHIEYEAVTVSDISNLKIRAKDGAKVLLSVDTAYAPVLTFMEDQHISIEGITAGHNVEPGYCSGSVLSFRNVYGLDISKCSLYGSGTYGIEAIGTYNINVSDTDIYECTYGLVDLHDIGSVQFTNCTMRDSKDMSMICISGAYDVVFDHCTFSGNVVADSYNYFVALGEYDSATFRDCTFKDNEFFTFSNRSVTMENCTDENNSAGFRQALGDHGELDADALREAYNKAVEKQQEIDDKLNDGSLMDQQSLNQTAYSEYELWDSLLNDIWTYLKSTLEQDALDALTEQQRTWIREKEAKMKSDAEGFAGGSMQPMVEYGSGAAITRSRVEELMKNYIK
ncbi:MAG: lysozyme inhibitor LprI family protein [Lachnospiraceae bacterium]|nr:lysozyme inhibitor LprI family protein [Lachnospiraceae bacterium]